MTPKEKSEQLVYRMMYKIQWSKVKYHTLMEAKECALIAVDEILKSNPTLIDCDKSELNYKYWVEVKQEIEKL
jgi:hypothetical protein